MAIGRPQECIQAFAPVQNQLWLLKTKNLYLLFTTISCSQFFLNIESSSGSTSVFVAQMSQVTFEILRIVSRSHMRRPLDRWAWRTSFTNFWNRTFLSVSHSCTLNIFLLTGYRTSTGHINQTRPFKYCMLCRRNFFAFFSQNWSVMWIWIRWTILLTSTWCK